MWGLHVSYRKEPRMSIGIQTPGIHHVALRSAYLQRSRQFYAEMLGFPILVQKSDFFIVAVGGVRGVGRVHQNRAAPGAHQTAAGAVRRADGLSERRDDRP